jgi:biopolymer transport protein ExbB/TolQ
MFAQILDIALVGLAALTAMLISWKVVKLYWPGLLGELRIEARVHRAEELDEALEIAERGLPLLATIAATAPFVGLAATVLHIMQGLQLLGGASVESSLLAGPIATALHSTLLGLASAVPAVGAYNLMARRLQVAENRVRRALSRKAQSESPKS